MAGHDQIQDSAPSRERYSRLAPLSVDTEMLLALQARQFFSPIFHIERRKPPPGQALTPASGKDFLDYLSESQSLPEEPDRYLHQIRGLLDRMVDNDLLVEMGVGGGGSFVMLPKSYYALSYVFALPGSGSGTGDGGGTLEPVFELGLRHDGGDAETGWGVDIGGGLRWHDPALGRVPGGPSSFELGIEATRNEPANDDAAPEHGVRLELGIRF